MCRVLKTDQHITNRNSFSNKMHTNSRTNRVIERGRFRSQGTKIHSYKSFIAIRNCDRM